MTPRLRTYVELERLMLILDEDGNPVAADALRDAMDPLWYSLSDEERRVLDDRTIGRIRSIEEIRVPVSSQLFGPAPAPPRPRPLPDQPLTGWTLAA